MVVGLFGVAYTPSAASVKILAVSLIPYTISAAWSVRRVTQGHERRVMTALAVSVVVTVMLNRWLISKYGVSGTALTVAISESVFAVTLLAWRR